MTSEQSHQVKGLSSEIWETLKRGDHWGKIATDLQKLDKLKNFKEPFVHGKVFIAEPPIGPIGRYQGNNNLRMHLEDARYGPIEGVADSKPSVWLIVRHEKEPQGQCQISPWALFRAWIITLSIKGANQIVMEVVAHPDIPVIVHQPVVIGSDTYALLGMHAEPGEKGRLYPWCATTLGDDEKLIVQLVNSNPTMKHTSVAWITPNPHAME